MIILSCFKTSLQYMTKSRKHLEHLDDFVIFLLLCFYLWLEMLSFHQQIWIKLEITSWRTETGITCEVVLPWTESQTVLPPGRNHLCRSGKLLVPVELSHWTGHDKVQLLACSFHSNKQRISSLSTKGLYLFLR